MKSLISKGVAVARALLCRRIVIKCDSLPYVFEQSSISQDTELDSSGGVVPGEAACALGSANTCPGRAGRSLQSSMHAVSGQRSDESTSRG